MVVPLRSEGSGITLLKGFMVAPGIMICGFLLSKYIFFTLLFNEAWFNIFNIVVTAPILPVLGFLFVYF